MQGKKGIGKESKRQKGGKIGGKREETGGKESCFEGIEEEAQKEEKRQELIEMFLIVSLLVLHSVFTAAEHF